MAEAPKLTREVLPPYKQSSGLGVMVVASTAMFFAVASSAFVLRARMSRSCPPQSMQAPVVIEVGAGSFEPVANARANPLYATDENCGAAVLERKTKDLEVYSFAPCAKAMPAAIGDRPIRHIKARHDAIKGGVLVDRVHLPKR